jgi:glycosyltransferase involved in cell wall biosynthesis
MDPKLTIVIPCYNEEEALPKILPPLFEFCEYHKYNLIIVNDGSKDSSKKILGEYNNKNFFKVINHKVNNGYGGAIKSGIKEAKTDFVITIDADGQHILGDIQKLYDKISETDADMVIGSRIGQNNANWFRGFGKNIIRNVTKLLMPIPIYDLNSGMKIYRTDLAQRYISLCPDGMAYSDVIALVFISNKHLVVEEQISIQNRISGKSTIGIHTAFHTVYEILNIILLFNPIRFFLPISLFCLLSGLIWGIPIILKGHGISVGSLLAINTGVVLFIVGLVAEQLSKIRKSLNMKYE